MTGNIAMHLYTVPQACISRDLVREVFMVGDAGTLAKREKRWKQLENDVGRNSVHSLRASTYIEVNILVIWLMVCVSRTSLKRSMKSAAVENQIKTY